MLDCDPHLLFICFLFLVALSFTELLFRFASGNTMGTCGAVTPSTHRKGEEKKKRDQQTEQTYGIYRIWSGTEGEGGGREAGEVVKSALAVVRFAAAERATHEDGRSQTRADRADCTVSIDRRISADWHGFERSIKFERARLTETDGSRRISRNVSSLFVC